MLDIFDPCPDVYTFHAERSLLPDRLAAAIVQESRVAALPGIRQRGHSPGRWRSLLPYMARYFERLDLTGYDVVISSSHACAVNVRPPGGTPHLCYCYTPMRYVWLQDTDGQRSSTLQRIILGALRSRLQRQDFAAAQRPDVYVAISSAVQERIKRFYGRSAEVIHPPVATEEFRGDDVKRPGEFLWVHRLVPYKRPLEVAAAFAAIPEMRLTMVGVGPLEERLRATKPPNVTVRGWVPRDELATLFARSSGFIHVGEEDFGITMVEALASGTPVLALDRGGAHDIIRPGIDGEHVHETSAASIADGVLRLSARRWNAAALCARAERFSGAVFRQELGRLIASHAGS